MSLSVTSQPETQLSATSSSSSSSSSKRQKVHPSNPQTAKIFKLPDALVTHMLLFAIGDDYKNDRMVFTTCRLWNQLRIPLLQNFAFANRTAAQIFALKHVSPSSNLRIKDFSGWGNRVQVLTIEKKSINRTTCDRLFSTFPQMKELSLISCEIPAAFFDQLHKLKNLEKLTFACNKDRAPVINAPYTPRLCTISYNTVVPPVLYEIVQRKN